MFIELTSKDGYTTMGGQKVPPKVVFIRTDDIRRILETTEGTKLVFSDGESLLISEQAVDIYHELKGIEESESLMGVWP